MKNFEKAWLGIALLVVAAAGCQPTTTTDEVEVAEPPLLDLRLQPQANQVYRYSVRVAHGIAEQPTEFSAVVETTVTAVETDRITLASRLQDVHMGGEPLPDALVDMVQEGRSTMIVDGRGQAIETPGDGLEGLPGAEQLMPAVMPGRPVRIGDSWEGPLDVGMMQVPATFRLTSVETLEGREAARIEATADPREDFRLIEPAVIWVEVATGMLLRLGLQAELPQQNALLRVSVNRLETDREGTMR
jgi:hypothetical protein